MLKLSQNTTSLSAAYLLRAQQIPPTFDDMKREVSYRVDDDCVRLAQTAVL
jgi:hypothetical protein